MRHDSYLSPWRKIAPVSALILLAALIVWGVVRTGQGASSTPSTSISVPTTESTRTSSDAQKTSDPALIDAVYLFVEAYNLPVSDYRNEQLKKLSTTEGYDMVYRTPADPSNADKAAGNIVVTVVRNDVSIQIEPFEDDTGAVSVYAELTVQIERDGTILNTVQLPGQTTSWVKESNGWKFAYIQA